MWLLRARWSCPASVASSKTRRPQSVSLTLRKARTSQCLRARQILWTNLCLTPCRRSTRAADLGMVVRIIMSAGWDAPILRSANTTEHVVRSRVTAWSVSRDRRKIAKNPAPAESTRRATSSATDAAPLPIRIVAARSSADRLGSVPCCPMFVSPRRRAIAAVQFIANNLATAAI